MMMQSKLANILSVGGHAIVAAEAGTEMSDLANKFPGIYECIEPENVDVFVDALKSTLDRDLSKPNQVARDYAVEYLSIDKVLASFEADMIKLVEG